MDFVQYIPKKAQEDVNPQQPEDFVVDGLLHCGVCRQQKQVRVQFAGREYTFPCMCECRMKERAEKEKARQYREDMEKISKLRESSMMSSAFSDAVFPMYQQTSANKRAYRVARYYVEKFSELEKKNQGLILYGTVGAGKSFTAACIANALMGKMVPVVMTSFVKILQDLQSRTLTEGEYISILNRARLLILDDLGAERSTDYALEKVYNIIDSRVRASRPMILTTNLTMDEMMNPADIRYRRIYDRIFGCCYPVEMVGPSMRMERAAARFEEMGGLIK